MAPPHELTDAQRAIADHPAAPLQVTGGFGTGKTTALAARARTRAAAVGQERVLLVGATTGAADRLRSLSAGAGTAATPVALGLAIIRRHEADVRLISGGEQRRLVSALLASEGRREWPTLHEHLGDPDLEAEVAATVVRFQASWLGDEELFVHADAAGELDRWEELAGFTRRYLAELDRQCLVDPAGALVRAALLLRRPDVAEAERALAQAVLVDDAEQLSFAAHRLLTLLTGPGADITFAGNPDGPVDVDAGGSSRHLREAARRFGGTALELDEPLRPEPAGAASTCAPSAELDAAARLICRELDRGRAPADVAAICPEPIDAVGVAGMLRDRGVPVGHPGGVAVVDAASTRSLEWPATVLVGCTPGRLPAPWTPHRWFDPYLLGGPDVPDEAARAARWDRDQGALLALATTRATELVAAIEPMG